ncbi:MULTISPECIES: anti-virulence regulator CigR family protein [Pseudomonas]|uniref:RcnB family protein n=1 Tax=Pseudomonas putida TaxID=303 RepID=A0AAW5HLG5_PSEPU|nr:anti-virulence regulator CigR family protein [Pseudomonas putida]MCO1621914.1 RcnB family protein [Pseudomonas putida]
MARSPIMTAIVTSLAVVLASGPALADPGNGKGQGQGQGHGKGQAQHAQGQGNSGGHKQSAGGNNWHGGPSIDRGDVLGILGGHRNYWSPGPALPPGIQKNLARGKPLPPGIAKKLDGRLLGQLPHYDGYEWMQAGADLILVAVATGIIYEVLNGAFD